MAVYDITDPQGQVWEVTAPDGASDDDVMAYAKQHYGSAANSETMSPPDEDEDEAGVAGTALQVIADLPKNLYGFGEAAFEMTTGLAGAVVGAVAGAGAVAKAAYEGEESPASAYEPVFSTVQEALTGHPKTEMGKNYSRWIAAPFHWASDKSIIAADATYEYMERNNLPGSELTATGVRVGLEAAALLVPFVGPKAAKAAYSKVTERVNKKNADSAPVDTAGDVSATASEPPRPVGKGTQNLDPRIISEAEFIDLKLLQAGEKGGKGVGKREKKALIDAAREEYPDYRREARSRIEKQFQEAVDEVVNGSLSSPKVDIRQMTYEELTSPDWVELMERPTQDLQAIIPGGQYSGKVPKNAGTKRSEVAEAWNQKEGLELPEREAVRRAAHDEVERRIVEDRVIQEEAMYAERGAVLAEERIDSLLSRSVHPVDSQGFSASAHGRKNWGKQGGSVNPSVYIEGLIKAGKSLEEVTRTMVKEFGDEWAVAVPALYTKIKAATPEAAPDRPGMGESVIERVANQARDGLIPLKARSRLAASTGLLNNLVEVVAGKSITTLRLKARENPILKAIGDAIERPETVKPGEIVKDDLTTSYYKASGDLLKRTADNLESVAPKWFAGFRETFRGKLPKDLNIELVRLLREKEIIGDSKTHKVAKEIRGILDEVKAAAADAGLGAEYLSGYFPRMIEIGKIRKDSKLLDDFSNVLAKYGMGEAEIYTLMERLINEDGILTSSINKSGRQGIFKNGQYSTPKKQANLELERKLKNIPDSALEPFLNNDVWNVLVKYIETATARTEFAKVFGADEAKLNRAVADAIEFAHKSGDPITGVELHRLYDLIDASQKDWIKIKDPHLRSASNSAVTAMNVITLPLAALSAGVEMALPLYGGGVKAYARAWPQALTGQARAIARGISRDVDKSIAQQTAESMLKASDLAATERVNALFNGEVTAVNTAFFKTNLLHSVTKFTNILAQETLTNLMMDFARKSNKRGEWTSKLPWAKAEHARVESFLNRLGVNKADLLAWEQRGSLRMKGDEFFDGQYKTAVTNFIHENVMTSRAAIRPMWHSIPHLAVFAHLKGFPTMFGNTVLKRWYLDTIGEFRQGNLYTGTRNTSYIAATGALMMFVADLGTQLSDLARHGGEHPKYAGDDQKRLYRAADRAGLFPPGGWSTIVNGIRAKEMFGGSPITSALGPTTGYADGLLSGLGAIHKSSRPLANTLARATPLVNINADVREGARNQYEKWIDNVIGRENPWDF